MTRNNLCIISISLAVITLFESNQPVIMGSLSAILERSLDSHHEIIPCNPQQGRTGGVRGNPVMKAELS